MNVQFSNNKNHLISLRHVQWGWIRFSSINIYEKASNLKYTYFFVIRMICSAMFFIWLDIFLNLHNFI